MTEFPPIGSFLKARTSRNRPLVMNERAHRDTSPDPEPAIEEARLRQQAIGAKLRHMFDEIVNEPVPEEFLEILRRADDKVRSGGQD